jgi:4-hydroxythreonine-4-phosphate dehydrogenase
MSEQRIRVAVTSGDINGVGLETVIKVFADPRMAESITPIIYAHPEVMKAHRKVVDVEDFQYNTIANAGEAIAKKVNLVNVWKDFKGVVEFGKPTKEAGMFAFKSLEAAVADLASNKVDVIVTSPINKDTIQSEEFNFPGHTEYLAKFANTEKVLMFLVSDTLRVGIVTGHLPLKEVSQHITKERIHEKLQRTVGHRRKGGDYTCCTRSIREGNDGVWTLWCRWIFWKRWLQAFRRSAGHVSRPRLGSF